MLFVHDLSVEYSEVGRTTYAVNGVSLDVPGGSVVGLVGESGSGKSTLALAILGLTRGRGRIASGNIEFEGENLLGLSDDAWREIRGGQIGLVPQNPRGALDPVERIGVQIEEYYLAHRDATEAEANARALELLTLVGINDPERRLRAFPHELSGGMAQRVLIAMALSCSPKLLIADEPTTALDVTIQAQILELLEELQEEFGMSILMITHDLGIVADLADSVAIMYAGQIVEHAATSALFANPRHPYTAGLFQSRPQLGRKKARLDVIAGVVPNPTDFPQGCRFHPRCSFVAEQCRQTSVSLEQVATGHGSACLRVQKEKLELPRT